MLPLGSNHLLCYVRLDERAKDLRTTTSSMQALSDEYPNNFCLITAVSTIADKRDNKATELARTGHQQKLTGRLRNREQRRSKPDDN